MAIQAIQTRFDGHLFRSRLEARWAVFFKALGIRYQYELEGFQVHCDIGNPESAGAPIRHYLPDFHLPDLGTWVEVKGSLDYITDDYLEMVAWAVDWGGALPGIGESFNTSRGLLWLGPMPSSDACAQGPPTHLILQHSKGGWLNLGSFFTTGSFSVTQSGNYYFDAADGGAAEAIRNALEQWVYPGGSVLLDERCDPDVRRAYERARCARFEHGQSG